MENSGEKGFIIAVNALRNISIPHWNIFRQSSADLYGFLEERISGTEDIRSSGAQAYMLRRLYHYTRTRLRTAQSPNYLHDPLEFFGRVIQRSGILLPHLVGAGQPLSLAR
jgi:ABC-type multidrug transport system fused ATPase/permease subunit